MPGSALERSWQIAALWLAAAIAPAGAQPVVQPGAASAEELPTFGLEFELRARGRRVTRREDQRYEKFERILRDVVHAIGGDPTRSDGAAGALRRADLRSARE